MQNTPSHLKNLNERQLEAVTHTKGPLLIIAGAGAGKTRTITHRMVHLIKQGVEPHKILAVTFTNKAAKEMKERMRALLNKDTEINRPINALSSGMTMPFMATFHSLGVHILRENAKELGIPRNFTIFDRSDSLRAIKNALKKLGFDPKQYEPKAVLHIISKSKSNNMDIHAFSESAKSQSYYGEIAEQVWKEYNKSLKKEGALDFDDLLVKTHDLLAENADIREKYQKRWQYIHIDEYQDTNTVQYDLMRLLVGHEQNICVVGDGDQCLVADTNITMADGSIKKIYNIKIGDEVLSNYGGGNTRSAKVTKVRKRITKKGIVRIHLKSGVVLESTPEHIHFAGYKLGESPQIYFVYLMYKKNTGWRIGVSQTYTKGQRKPMLGYIQRTNHEHADAVWVIATYASISKAREAEYILSLTYQLPTIPFKARKTNARVQTGYVHNQKVLDGIFEKFNTDVSAKKLLKDYGLYEEYPHHRPQSSSSDRRNIIATICSSPRGNSVLHSISVYGNDKQGKDALHEIGFKTRWGGHNPNNWRFEARRVSMKEWQEIIENIKKALPEANVVYQARIGKTTKARGEKNSLPFLPASSVREGMIMCNNVGKWDIVTKVEQHKDTITEVYDLDVEKTHNFIANNIVTHNCVYTWREAKPENINHFEREFDNVKTVFLEQNYRSTGNILAAANDIITKNINRKDKKLFTENHEGEKISIYGAYNAGDEARYIANECERLISEEGIEPRNIAVLYRANFQSRNLEEQFLYAGVPYQVLGTKFFDRKEIKDVLSYVRAALNPKSVADMTRAVSTPSRGIGKMTLTKMLDGTEHTLGPALQEKVRKFKNTLTEIAHISATKKPSETLTHIIKASGMEQKYKNGTEEEKERLENLKELVTLATKYDHLEPTEGIEHLLQDAALATDQDELQEDNNAVKLMTVHASKGLEFDYVFVTGLEEGLFPHEKMGDEDIDDEEERRLFYVAITRAGKKLYLTHAMTRIIYGKEQSNIPSHFLNDLNPDYVEDARVAQNGDDSDMSNKVDLIDF